MQNNYVNNERPEDAGFFVRLFAYFVDIVIVSVGLLVVRLLIAGMLALLKDTPLSGNILFHYTLKDILLYIFQVIYFILMTYYTGTTLGKKLLNLRVIAVDERRKPSFMDILFRETIGRFLSGLILGIGYIMAGIDKNKQGFHDKLSDTRVVYAKKVKIYPVFQNPPFPNPPLQNPPNYAQEEGMRQ